MIQVSATVFQELFKLGILNGKNRSEKEWTVTSRRKPARRKKHYISRDHYAKYLSMKNSENKEIKGFNKEE